MLLSSSIFHIGFISPSLSHKTKQLIFHFSLGHILALQKKKSQPMCELSKKDIDGLLG